jgi:aminoglycoside phosphotransferase (APT) family kinase protein
MKYSKRLGEISNEQLQKALNQFDLGEFIKARPVDQGLFGQNLFLTSSKGEFVLRGVPHYSWQFKNERLFAKLLKEKISVPVPWPYLLDEETDIFDWSYVIMPKLKGIQLSDSDLGSFKESELKAIAEAQGKMLAEMQKLTWNRPGKYDEKIDAIKPFKESFFVWFRKNIFQRLEKAQGYNNKTKDSDLAWVKDQFKKAKGSLQMDFKPCFVMQDYKPGNMVVDRVHGNWQVTGLFDLMESYIGHGEADVSRMFCVYVDLKRKGLAQTFVKTYREEKGRAAGFDSRFPIFIIHDRAIIWEWVQRTDRVWWDKSFTFRQWVESFIKV